MIGWVDLPFFSTQEFVDIVKELDAPKGATTLPARENVFRAFRETPFEQVKVVILGQDPYPTKTHAIGLAFAVPSDLKPLPKSLINIHTELEKDTGIRRLNGDLTGWTAQGVFLLNTALTVQEGKPGSHTELWRKFTDNVIQRLSEHRENLVFVLWGNHAISKAHLIDATKHLVIVSAHPSPLSAHRGFFGSKPFSRTNEYLISKNITPIKW